MRTALMCMCCLIAAVVSAGTVVSGTGDYLGQEPPGDKPVVFAPGAVSVNGRYEYGLALSPRGDEMFFTAEYPPNIENHEPDGLMVLRRDGDRWSEAVVADLRGDGSWEQEAFYTVGGDELYFCSQTGEMKFKLWFAARAGAGWGVPKLLESPVNTTADVVFYASFTADGTMYYTNVDDRKVYRARRVDGAYPSVEVVDVPGGHAFVAPDESFLLLDSGRDIVVVFAADGGWTEPVGLGDLVCTDYTETCPSLSPDGKYIFFSRYDEPGEISNILWVSGDIIGRLRPTPSDDNQPN